MEKNTVEKLKESGKPWWCSHHPNHSRSLKMGPLWAWPKSGMSVLGFKTFAKIHGSPSSCPVGPCPTLASPGILEFLIQQGRYQGPRVGRGGLRMGATYRSVLDQIVPDWGASVILLDQVHFDGVPILSHLPFQLGCAGFPWNSQQTPMKSGCMGWEVGPSKRDGVMRWGWALSLLYQKFKWLTSSEFRALNPTGLPHSVMAGGALWECSGKHSLWTQFFFCLSHWYSHFFPQLYMFDFYTPDTSWQSAWNMGKCKQVWIGNFKASNCFSE